jgi:hypothetical protein
MNIGSKKLLREVASTFCGAQPATHGSPLGFGDWIKGPDSGRVTGKQEVIAVIDYSAVIRPFVNLLLCPPVYWSIDPDSSWLTLDVTRNGRLFLKRDRQLPGQAERLRIR